MLWDFPYQALVPTVLFGFTSPSLVRSYRQMCLNHGNSQRADLHGYGKIDNERL